MGPHARSAVTLFLHAHRLRGCTFHLPDHRTCLSAVSARVLWDLTALGSDADLCATVLFTAVNHCIFTHAARGSSAFWLHCTLHYLRTSSCCARSPHVLLHSRSPHRWFSCFLPPHLTHGCWIPGWDRDSRVPHPLSLFFPLPSPLCTVTDFCHHRTACSLHCLCGMGCTLQLVTGSGLTLSARNLATWTLQDTATPAPLTGLLRSLHHTCLPCTTTADPLHVRFPTRFHLLPRALSIAPLRCTACCSSLLLLACFSVDSPPRGLPLRPHLCSRLLQFATCACRFSAGFPSRCRLILSQIPSLRMVHGLRCLRAPLRCRTLHFYHTGHTCHHTFTHPLQDTPPHLHTSPEDGTSLCRTWISPLSDLDLHTHTTHLPAAGPS